MARRFNPAPGWPPAPAGWLPPDGWRPDPSWPPAPPGWQYVVDDAPAGMPAGPLAPPTADARPWWKKKRFLLPAGGILLIGFIGSLGGNGDDEPVTAAPSVAASADPDLSAEEIAEQEEAERQAEEDRAAEEAAREAEEAAAREAEEAQKAAEEAAKAAEEAAAEAAEAARIGTLSQQNAYRSAQSYLDFTGFSRAGLIGQLTSEYGEGFPAADAEFAVARLEAEGLVDWNAEALESAQSYLEMMAFSRSGLIEQLTSEYGEQFTLEQATYAVNEIGL